jgi:hypothetical protein
MIVQPQEQKYTGIAHANVRKSQVAYFLPGFPYERLISIAANP